jgi:GT2 family glycosyltransferase
MNSKKATIIIPHHNRHDHLHTLLDILDNKEFDIIIVSGGSFAENCNRGAKIAETEKLIFMNDDTKPTNENLLQIIATLNMVDFVGSTQIVKNNKKYFGIGFMHNINGSTTNHKNYKYYPQIQLQKNASLFPSGFLFGIKKYVWEQLNGFNENFKTGYEDVDFGVRCLEKKISMAILDLEIKHDESESEGRFRFCQENTDLFNKIYSQKKLKELYENTYYCI